jgi:hypothetical protein
MQELHIESLFTPETRHYGLELQLPFSELLLSGTKTIETRAYPLPSTLLYRHILIIEAPAGQDGRSALSSIIQNTTGTEIDATTSYASGGTGRSSTADAPGAGAGTAAATARIVGSVVFSECFCYQSEEGWHAGTCVCVCVCACV